MPSLWRSVWEFWSAHIFPTNRANTLATSNGSIIAIASLSLTLIIIMMYWLKQIHSNNILKNMVSGGTNNITITEESVQSTKTPLQPTILI